MPRFLLLCCLALSAASARHQAGLRRTPPVPLNRESTKPTPAYQEVTPAPPPVPVDNDDYLFEYHNPLVTDGGQELFESDMVLTEEQRADRQAKSNIWPDGAVKYAITASSEPDRAAIQAALQHWSDRTCLQFTEVDQSFASEPHVRFTKQSGCWSYVGRIDQNSGQDISIGDGCTGLATIVHELGHALGLYHQQSRTDRDTYVIILYDNIQAGREGNFGIAASSNNHSVPYDYTSVMHYGSIYFSKSDQPTIAVRQLKYSGLIGSRTGLSHRDAQIANAMYSCADCDCVVPPTCENGGYVGASCACICPGHTSGDSCQTVSGSYYGEVCGDQEITAPGTVTSLSWPELYPPGKNCFWIITAPATQRVQITFATAKVLDRYSDGNCYWDWIRLYTDDDVVADQTACGSELQNESFTSTGNRFALEMHSYPGDNHPNQTGFEATIQFV